MDSQARRRISLLFVMCMLLCIVLYLPGLKGGYLFDDYPNIVDNPAIHLTSLDAASLQRAFWATPASGTQRPLATLSFALSHYFTGLAPQPMKATNLAIHLINGWLLFLLLSKILRFSATAAATSNATRGQWLAALVAGVWLLHPINLSAVLFVVQRMESLAQLFVLLGLLLYVDARTQQTRGMDWRLWLGFPVCLLLGMATKESAVLLPLYALLLEGIIFRSAPRRRRELTAFYAAFLLIPLAVGLAWILPTVLSPAAYSTRHFTLAERLLTEPRVLADYALWTALPIPQFSRFYHDDYLVSTGLTTPWTTLPAILTLIVAAIVAWKMRHSRPFTSLGLAWFLAAHAMTATVIPLELAFEHRNYFASAGLLLALFDLMLPTNRKAPMAGLGLAMIFIMVALALFTLNLKARTWGNPVLFAVTEAAESPESPRATYELGRTYALLSGFRADSLNLAQAIAALEIAAAVPRASAMPESTLIIASSKSGAPVKPEWWQSLIEKIASRTITAEDIGAIRALTECRRDGHCAENDGMFEKMYRSALERRRSPEILYSFAIHAHNVMNDSELSLGLAREAAGSGDLQYQVNLVGFLIALGKTQEARKEMESLLLRDRKGALKVEIDVLRAKLDIEAEQ